MLNIRRLSAFAAVLLAVTSVLKADDLSDNFSANITQSNLDALAKDMGAGERSVRNYLKELEEAGYLEVKQRGLGKTNLYRLFLVVTKKPSTKPAK